MSGLRAHQGRSGCGRLRVSAARLGLGPSGFATAARRGGAAEGRWKCPRREMGQRGDPGRKGRTLIFRQPLGKLAGERVSPSPPRVAEPLAYPFSLQVAGGSPNPKVQV